MALIFSVLLIVAGLMPVLYFLGLVAWQIVTLVQTGSWMALPVVRAVFTEQAFAAGFALAGLCIIALGVRGIRKHLAAVRARRDQSEDALRRVQDYQRDSGTMHRLDGRREPYIAM